MCLNYVDIWEERVKKIGYFHIVVSTICLVILFVLFVPYDTEYLPTTKYQFFFVNITVVSISFIDFFTVICNKRASKIILLFSLIIKAAFCAIFIMTLYHNLVIYFQKEMIENFKCEGTLFKNSTVNALDKMFLQLDQFLCSDECSCNIRNIQDYLTKSNLVTVNQWSYSDKQGSVNIQGCAINDIESIMKRGNISIPDIFFYRQNREKEIFNFHNFISFWSGVEKQFECSGFCAKLYLNGFGVRTSFTKYLFSDVNLGVPRTLGCFTSLQNWVLEYYFYASIILSILILSQFMNFVSFAGLIFWSRERPYQKASQINYSEGFESNVQMTDLFNS
jgi:hypothetical protein